MRRVGGHQTLTKEAAKYAEECGLQLKLPACVTSDEGEVIPGGRLKSRLRKERELRLKGDKGAQKWQGKLETTREDDEELSTERCYWWLIKASGEHAQHIRWRVCSNYTNITHSIVRHTQDTCEFKQQPNV